MYHRHWRSLHLSSIRLLCSILFHFLARFCRFCDLRLDALLRLVGLRRSGIHRLAGFRAVCRRFRVRLDDYLGFFCDWFLWGGGKAAGIDYDFHHAGILLRKRILTYGSFVKLKADSRDQPDTDYRAAADGKIFFRFFT